MHFNTWYKYQVGINRQIDKQIDGFFFFMYQNQQVKLQDQIGLNIQRWAPVFTNLPLWQDMFLSLATSLFFFFFLNHLALSPALPTLSGHWKPLVRFYHWVNSNEVGRIDKHILRKEPEHRELEALRRERRERHGAIRELWMCVPSGVDRCTDRSPALFSHSAQMLGALNMIA